MIFSILVPDLAAVASPELLHPGQQPAPARRPAHAAAQGVCPALAVDVVLGWIIAIKAVIMIPVLACISWKTLAAHLVTARQSPARWQCSSPSHTLLA